MSDDVEIVRATIITMMAHIYHLTELNVISKEISSKILRELLHLLESPEVLFKQDFEDIHEALEAYLIDKLGIDGGWIGIARSRNDHVATALRIRMREYIIQLLEEILKLRYVILKRAKKYIDTLIPTFTHQQPAQITTIGHYLLSIDEMLRTYWKTIKHILEEVVNKSPLGSGASAGTIVNLDRYRLAELLGFNGIVVNTLYAIETRNFFTITLSIINSMLIELNRFINDLITWSTPEFNYIKNPKDHVATSSIMPHKQNPVTLEIFRARIGEAYAHYSAIMNILRPLCKGYLLDMQEASRHAWNVLKITLEGIKILNDYLSKIKFNIKVLEEEVNKYPLISSEIVEYLTLSSRRSFREVYFQIAEEIKKNINIQEKYGIKPRDIIRLKSIAGSPNPKLLEVEIESNVKELNNLMKELQEFRSRVENSINRLIKSCEEIAKLS